MVFVVSVHTLAFAGGTVTMSIGAVTTIFHTSRELFLLLTALVLTYNYGQRPLKAGRFWRRRFWLVLPAYVTWSAIYYAADGRSRGAFPSAFLHDLANAGARYHLYFLLVSMQIYLLFPLIRWVLKKTEGYHAWLFGAALAYQAWLTVGLHYKVGRQRQRARRAVPERRRAGLLDRHLRPVRGGGRARGLALRATVRVHPAAPAQRVARRARGGRRRGRGHRRVPDRDRGLRRDAEQRERRLPAGRHLRGARLRLGAARRRAAVERPGSARPEVRAAGSASSFGIYLAHPLVLQVLLLVAGSTTSAPTAASSAGCTACRTPASRC